MSVQSWQVPCPRCGWANSGAMARCGKCGQPLSQRPGMLVAGESASRRSVPPPPSTQAARPGGFLPRLIALIIDFFILSAIALPIQALWVAQLTPSQVNSSTNLALENLQRQGSLGLVLFLIDVFYFAGSWTIVGGTPGQLVMSLRVTDANAKGIGFFRGVLRYLVMVIFGILAPISAIMVALGGQKRAIHDLLAGTYVIQIVDKSEPATDTGLPAAVAPASAPPAAAPSPAPAPVVPAPAAPVAAPPALEPLSPASPAAEDVVSSGLSDADLYAPPPLVDTTTSLEEFTAPAAPVPADREVYTPKPAEISEAAAHTAELYKAAEVPFPPLPVEGDKAPGEPPTDLPPADAAAPPPVELPPMAPPPEEKG